MAAVIGDFISDPSAHFHNMLASTGLSHQRKPSHESSYRSSSCPRNTDTHRSSPSSRQRREPGDNPNKPAPSASGASRFPTPPSSSSPSVASANIRAQNAEGAGLMATQAHAAAHVGPSTTTLTSPRHQQPSPSSDASPATTAIGAYPIDEASSPRSQSQGQTIRVRDLAHIQSLARADVLTGNGSGLLSDSHSQQVKYEISGMPIGDIIEMVAALLTKITTTNDLQHDAMQRNVAHQQQANQNSEAGHGSSMSPLSTSVLAFHGKNIPAITILSYLSRIHKYCPTTFEVFLSLLVYFDRMTERVNDMVVKSEEARRQGNSPEPQTASTVSTAKDVDMDDGEGGDAESDSDLADDDDDDDGMQGQSSKKDGDETPSAAGATSPAITPATYFVVDSFNIHRLVIAGVTCASKFFSDVFYTNSRYAKVGGLPLAELNHLELQFLLLNDFRLAVPVEDLEAYATMLVEFYAREVVVPQSRSVPADA
ncbi:PHO85 cyclin-6 [Plectosphaerella cucumerina]|uniref:PHO85 cyclin-6 n=1 Tax=Plectosphaerella cucumerina TaxID=40658 RepID=A0A8K0TPP1_9PEZI|nr:PHO85 cyclin-6 [Plectosphaerella cucumerina]